jgi:hypothetical protein
MLLFALLLGNPLLAAGPERPIGTLEYLPSVALMEGAVAASSGDQFLIGWQRPRPRLARVSAEGAVLDPTGFPVDQVFDLAGGPDGYLRVWNDRSSIRAGAISRQGEVAPARAVHTPGAGGQLWTPSVASGHGRFAVAWMESEAGIFRLVAATVDSSATTMIKRVLLETSHVEVDVAATNSGFAFAVKRQAGPLYQLAVIRTDVDLNITGTTVIAETPGRFDIPRWLLASNGGQVAIAWGNPASVARIFDDGTVGTVRQATTFGYPTAFAADGEGYVLVTGSFQGTLVRLDANGAPLPAQVPLYHNWAATASNGRKTIVVWDKVDYDVGDLRAGFVENDGTVAPLPSMTLERAPVESPRHQNDFESADSESSTLAVWVERSGQNQFAVMSQVWDRNHEPAAPPRELTPSGWGGVYPSVASDGRDFLVVWSENLDRVRITLVSEDGSPRTSAVIGDLRYSAASVAWNGEAYLVATVKRTGELQLVRVSASGERLGTIDYPFGFAMRPRLLINGARGLLAWEANYHYYSGGGCAIPEGCIGSSIAAVRITADGDPIGEPFSLSEGITDGVVDYQVALASDGTDYAVAWQDLYRGGVARAIVSQDGRVRKHPAIPVDDLAVYGAMSDIAWNGREYLYTWSDYTWSRNEGDVFVMPLGRDGHSLLPEGARWIVSGSPDPELKPRFLSSASGSSIVYERLATEIEYGGVDRLFRRALPSLDNLILPASPVAQSAMVAGAGQVKLTWVDPNPDTEAILIEVSSVDALWETYEVAVELGGEYTLQAPEWQRLRIRFRARTSTGISGYSNAVDTYPQPPRRTRKR